MDKMLIDVMIVVGLAIEKGSSCYYYLYYNFIYYFYFNFYFFNYKIFNNNIFRQNRLVANENLTNLPAERLVLTGIFQHGIDGFLDVVDFLQTDTFTDPTNQTIYKVYKHLFEDEGLENLDISSVLSGAKSLNEDWVFTKASEQKHLKSIVQGRVQLENVRKFAGQIRKLQIARLLQEQLDSASYRIGELTGKESVEEILGIAESSIFDFTDLLTKNNNSEPKTIGNGLEEYINHIESNPVDIVGISTGMPYFDQIIGGGMQRGTTTMIGARKKIGKSMLATNIALHVTKNLNIPVLLLDTEMLIEKHWNRTLANLTYEMGEKVTINEIKTGKYSEYLNKKKSIREASQILNDIPLHYLNIAGKPFEEVISIIRRWVNKTEGSDKLIIYDYINKLMSGNDINSSLQEYQILAFMIVSFNNFIIRNNIVGLTFAQLNRDGISEESSGVLAGSDRILDTVDSFTIFKNKTEEEIADNPEAGNKKLVNILVRDGEGTDEGDYVNIHFHGRYGKIIEGETKNNLKWKQQKQQKQQQNTIINTIDLKDL